MIQNDNFSDLAHFTWCAQVAVKIAFADKPIPSETETHLFLMRWLRTALKQKRFPRTVARDLNHLLAYGARHGTASNLLSKIQFLHCSCEDITLQSDLFRLTCATEALKDRQFSVNLQTDRDWRKRACRSLTRALYLPASLSRHFDDDGGLLSAVPLRVPEGDREEVQALFIRYQLNLNLTGTENGISQLELTRL